MVTDERELKLLRHTAQVHPTPLTLSAIQELLDTSDIDWPGFLAMASRHGLTPLIYKTLDSHFSPHVPASILSKFQQVYQESAQRNFLLMGHLMAVLEIFQAQGIQAVPYKGPVLAETIYGDLALRQFSDMDIIIRRSDARQARALLHQNGYRLKEWGTPRTEWFYIWKKGVCMYTRGDTVGVNLHWRVTMLREFSFPLQSREFWRDLHTQRLFGREVYIVPPEDLLLILCIHGARHYWERMRWLCDINELILAHPELNWSVLRRRAQSLGNERLLLHSLDLSHRLFHTPVESELLQHIEADELVQDLSQFVLKNTLFNADPNLAKHYPEYYINIRERWRERLWPYVYHRLYARWRRP